METFSQIMSETFLSLWGWTQGVAPKVGAAVVVLAGGWIVANIVRLGLRRGLGLIGFDSLAERTGLHGVLQRGQVKASASQILCKVVYWVMMVLTALVSLSTIGVPEAGLAFTGVMSMIPKVVLAVFVLVLGFSFSGFLAELVQTAAVNGNLRQARLVSNATKYALNTLVVIMALTQLGVATHLLVQSFLILFGAAGLGLALAFGLGCRDLARKIAENFWSTETEQSKALTRAKEQLEARDLIFVAEQGKRAARPRRAVEARGALTRIDACLSLERRTWASQVRRCCFVVSSDRFDVSSLKQ